MARACVCMSVDMDALCSVISSYHLSSAQLDVLVLAASSHRKFHIFDFTASRRRRTHTAAFFPVFDPGWHPRRLMNICCALWRIKKYVFGNNSHRIYERIYAWQRKMFGANAQRMNERRNTMDVKKYDPLIRTERRVAEVAGVGRCRSNCSCVYKCNLFILK